MSHPVRAPFLAASDRNFDVHGIPSGTDNIVWLLLHRSSRRAAAIDGPAARETLAFCEAHGIQLECVLHTHQHADHQGISRDLLQLRHSVRVFAPRTRLGEFALGAVGIDEGDVVDLWGEPVAVLRTEGHVDGHLSFQLGDWVFCGDTLFAAGCGYLFDGPPAKMWGSLERFAAMSTDTLFFPAHEYTLDNLRFARSVEPNNEAIHARIADIEIRVRDKRSSLPTSMNDELRTNPFLRLASQEIQRSVAKLGAPPLEVFTALRSLKNAGSYRNVVS